MTEHVLGKFLGEGKSRIVYEYLPDSSYVIKINKTNQDLNILEHNTYLYFKSCGLDHLLAPCKYISGQFLMKKVQRPDKGLYQIPCYFSKKDYNWGTIDNKLVRIDYAWNIINLDNKHYVAIDSENMKNINNIPNMHIIELDKIFLIEITHEKLKLWTQHTHTYEVK